MTNEHATPLAVEIAAFNARKEELERAYHGKFVVFKGDEFIGSWDTLNAAATEAASRFGRGPYLIRQIGAPEAVLPASVLYRELEPV